MELSTMNNTGLAYGAEGGTADSVQYIVIRLGMEQYGIDIRSIDNIVRMQSITRVPKMPDFLKGVINLRGEVIPIVSMRLKMKLEADEITKNTRIIVLNLEQEGKVGFIVDEVREVVTLEPSQVEKITYNAKDENVSLINAVGKHNDELISLFDLNAISLEDN